MARKRRSTESSDSDYKKFLAEVSETYGAGSHRKANVAPKVRHIPFGSFVLDFATMGGAPEGFNSMIYGYPSCGKTTLVKKLVAGYQAKYAFELSTHEVAWLDHESLFDPDWASVLGCDTERIELFEPSSGQEGVNLIDGLMKVKEVGLIVVDSIPSMSPAKILEKAAEDLTMGELARLMGIMATKITSNWNDQKKLGHNVTILTINQFRSKVGVTFGDPRTLPGGFQVNHLPALKIELKNEELMGKDSYGNDVHYENKHSFKLTKTKHGAAVKQGEFQMAIATNHDSGVSQGGFIEAHTVLLYAEKMGLFDGAGQKWNLHGVDSAFKKKKDAEDFLVENPEHMLLVKQMLIALNRIDKDRPAVPSDGYLLDWIEDPKDFIKTLPKR